jgi:hypothetical protein
MRVPLPAAMMTTSTAVIDFPSTGFITVINVARIIGVLGLLVALAGCSAIRLGYSNLPEVAYWWLDGYFDFDDAQTTRVRDELGRLHAWHRTEELPRIVALLQRTERLVAADLTPPQVCSLVPELRARMQAAAERAEPAMAATALSLGPENLAHLERKYARNNHQFLEEWVRLTPADLLAKRTESITERAETFYGTLNDAQRTALRQQLERSAFDAHRSLAERQRRQQDTLAVLRQLAGKKLPLDEARAQVRSVVERGFTPSGAAQRSHQDAMFQEGCSIVAALHNAATPEQRERAVRRLRAYQRDFQELSLPG